MDSGPVTLICRGFWSQASSFIHMRISEPKFLFLKTSFHAKIAPENSYGLKMISCVFWSSDLFRAKLLALHSVSANYCIFTSKVHSLEPLISPFSSKFKSSGGLWKIRAKQVFDRGGTGKERAPGPERKYEVLGADVFISQFCVCKQTDMVYICENTKLHLLWNCTALGFPSLLLTHCVKGLRFIKRY